LKIENHENIQGSVDNVIQFWFGKSPELQHKQLWMVSELKRRDAVDEVIMRDFFNHVVDLSSNEEIRNRWCQTMIGTIAAIVVLDQFTRHIHRYLQAHPSEDSKSLPPIDITDAIATQLAQTFHDKFHSQIYSGQVPLPMYIFSMMPYRHGISSTGELKSVLERIDDAESLYLQQSEALLKRFRNATTRRLNVLYDESRRLGYLNGSSPKDFGQVHQEVLLTQDSTNVIPDEAILEFFPFQADMAPARQHTAVTTVQQFVTSLQAAKEIHVIPKTNLKNFQCNRNLEALNQPVNNLSKTTALIVSLSGGVDSMVIASILADISDSASPLYSHNIKVFAAHIDYANRPESSSEAAYIQRYCIQKCIHYKCRRIEEVTRGITERDEYEAMSRVIRYDLYKQIIQDDIPNFMHQSGITDYEVLGVMLGHHKGDLRENVLSNACKGCGPLELSGMTSVSKIEGVTVLRPLLSLEKEVIFDYAHKFGVPYFKDTTPHWSTRGRLRNRLLPILTEVYGDGCFANLSRLAVESDAAKELVTSMVVNPFFDQVRRFPMGLSFETSPWKNMASFYWKFVLRMLMHSAGRGMFTDKSVQSFLDRIQVDGNPKSGWLQCRKDYAVYLEESGKVFVFHPESFPWSKQDQYQIEAQGLNYPTESSATVGPWKISVSDVSVNDENLANNLLSSKAVNSIEHLMEGNISYHLKLPKIISPYSSLPLLTFETLTKRNRPEAWTSTDIKIQSILPILTASSDAHGALAESSEFDAFRIVLVNMTLAEK